MNNECTQMNSNCTKICQRFEKNEKNINEKAGNAKMECFIH